MRALKRMRAYATLFAFVLLAGPLHLMLLGALGLSSSTAITGAFHVALLTGTIILGLMSRPHTPLPTSFDALFAAFLACSLISIALNFKGEHVKEYGLFLLFSAGAYAAGRLAPRDVLPMLGWHVALAAALITFAACAVTLPYLAERWTVDFGRPFVFGFPHSATVFTYGTGIMIIAFVLEPDDRRRWRYWTLLALISAATLIFLLSLVRFIFVALAATLTLLWVLSWWRSFPLRRLVHVSSIVVACLAVAVVVRPAVGEFGSLAIRSAMAPTAVGGPNGIPPSCAIAFDKDNSVRQRSALLQDALFFLPKAGFFGYGLNEFQETLTCYRGFSPHVIVLQAGVELGWLAGLSLVALMAAAAVGGLRHCASELLLPALLIFTALIGLVHGSISRAPTLFLLLGAIAAWQARAKDLKA